MDDFVDITAEIEAVAARLPEIDVAVREMWSEINAENAPGSGAVTVPHVLPVNDVS